MISWPWDSVIQGFDESSGFPLYDRGFTAEQLREVLMTFFSDGVFLEDKDAFHVKKYSGMSVTVSPGRCFIQGDIGVERTDRILEFEASTSQPRYDTVVLRWDNNLDARSIDLYVKKGVASERPSRPSLTRGETVWELGLCDIFIPANSTSIDTDRITDTRLDSARCGAVVPFDRIDTTTFFDQLQAAVDNAVELAETIIDGTAIGHLQTQINDRVKIEGDTMTGELNLNVPLGIASGGTGADTNKAAVTSLLSEMTEATGEFNDNSILIGRYGDPDDTNGTLYSRSITGLWTYLWKKIYPVGSVYIAYTATSPASRFGGNWTQITGGYFLRAANDVNTGGANTVTLTAAQSGLRSHTHNANVAAASGSGAATIVNTSSKANNWVANYIASVSSADASSSHSNTPLYQDLYVWRRTS